MSQDDPFASIPTSTADLIAGIDPANPQLDVDLNRIQSARIQELLRAGTVTPEQVAAWREASGPVTALPATVAVTGIGGRTQPDAPFQTSQAVRSFELSPEQRTQIVDSAQATSQAPTTHSIGIGDAGASVADMPS